MKKIVEIKKTFFYPNLFCSQCRERKERMVKKKLIDRCSFFQWTATIKFLPVFCIIIFLSFCHPFLHFIPINKFSERLIFFVKVMQSPSPPISINCFNENEKIVNPKYMSMDKIQQAMLSNMVARIELENSHENIFTKEDGRSLRVSYAQSTGSQMAPYEQSSGSRAKLSGYPLSSYFSSNNYESSARIASSNNNNSTRNSSETEEEKNHEENTSSVCIWDDMIFEFDPPMTKSEDQSMIENTEQSSLDSLWDSKEHHTHKVWDFVKSIWKD